MWKEPSGFVTAKYGVGTATTNASISGWTLQRSVAASHSFLNVYDRISPFGQVPRLNLSAQLSGEKTLWRTASELWKSTVVPTRTARTCGENTRFSWLIFACSFGAG